MQDTQDSAKRQAVRALINIALWEGAVLMAVVGVYLYTRDLTHLIGGMIGSALIFGPMIIRWYNEHGAKLNASAKHNRNAN